MLHMIQMNSPFPTSRCHNLNSKRRRITIRIIQLAPNYTNNVDCKVAPKVIAKRIESSLPNLVHSDQTGFIKGRYIGQNIRLIIDIIKHTKSQNIPVS